MLLALQLSLVLFLEFQFNANQHSGGLRDLQIHLLRLKIDIERVRAVSCPQLVYKRDLFPVQLILPVAFDGLAVDMDLLYEGIIGVQGQSAAALIRMGFPIKASVLRLNPVIGVADRDVLPATRILHHLQFVSSKIGSRIEAHRK